MGILAGTTFSDHAPVILVFEEQRRPPSQQMRIPESVSTDLGLRPVIEHIWLGARGQDVDLVEQCVLGLRGISLCLHETARSRLEECRERERQLRIGLQSIKHLQEQRPHDMELEEQLSLARQEIREMSEPIF